MTEATQHEHGVCVALLGPTGFVTELIAGGHGLIGEIKIRSSLA